MRHIIKRADGKGETKVVETEELFDTCEEMSRSRRYPLIILAPDGTQAARPEPKRRRVKKAA